MFSSNAVDVRSFGRGELGEGRADFCLREGVLDALIRVWREGPVEERSGGAQVVVQAVLLQALVLIRIVGERVKGRSRRRAGLGLAGATAGGEQGTEVVQEVVRIDGRWRCRLGLEAAEQGAWSVSAVDQELAVPFVVMVLAFVVKKAAIAGSKPVEFLEVDVGVPALTEAGIDLGLEAAKLGVVPGCSMWPGRSQAGRRGEATFGQGCGGEGGDERGCSRLEGGIG